MYRLRQLVHVAVGLGFWALFGLMWWMLFRKQEADLRAVFDSTRIILGLGTVIFAMTLWWVIHNLRIYRHKGPRAGKPQVAPRTDQDRLGRPVAWNFDLVLTDTLTAGQIVIEIEGDVKLYTPQQIWRGAS